MHAPAPAPPSSLPALGPQKLPEGFVGTSFNPCKSEIRPQDPRQERHAHCHTAGGGRDPLPPASRRLELLGTPLPPAPRSRLNLFLPSDAVSQAAQILGWARVSGGHIQLTLGQLCPAGPPQDSLLGRAPRGSRGPPWPLSCGKVSLLRLAPLGPHHPLPPQTWAHSWGQHVRDHSALSVGCAGAWSRKPRAHPAPLRPPCSREPPAAPAALRSGTCRRAPPGPAVALLGQQRRVAARSVASAPGRCSPVNGPSQRTGAEVRGGTAQVLFWVSVTSPSGHQARGAAGQH